MKVYRSKDNKVSKFIHDDGSETCIKTVDSARYEKDEDGKVKVYSENRNKYSVFVSTSAGCPMACKFCYLTIDDVRFKKLKWESVVDNVEASIAKEMENPLADLKNRFIKLCYMGMGDVTLSPGLLYHGTHCILNKTTYWGRCSGLDGVDLSTVMPKNSYVWLPLAKLLNIELHEWFDWNPITAKNGRSKVRVFYSLHSGIEESRRRIIPNTLPLRDALPNLRYLQDSGINVHFHHMFLEGINDTEEELDAVIKVMQNFPESQLRILRYNKNDRSALKESAAFEQCVCYLQGEVKNIKVQFSYGEDVKSACGQFAYNSGEDIEPMRINRLVA